LRGPLCNLATFKKRGARKGGDGRDGPGEPQNFFSSGSGSQSRPWNRRTIPAACSQAASRFGNGALGGAWPAAPVAQLALPAFRPPRACGPSRREGVSLEISHWVRRRQILREDGGAEAGTSLERIADRARRFSSRTRSQQSEDPRGKGLRRCVLYQRNVRMTSAAAPEGPPSPQRQRGRN